MRTLLIAILLAGSLSIATARESVFPGKTWELATAESQGVDRVGLDAALHHLASISGPDGISQTMVVRHGRVIWQGDHTDSWHNVFSCTKSFLSITTGLLVEDGILGLETPLYTFVPGLKEHYPDMTAARCLSLTAGYTATDSDNPFTPAAPLFKDGSAFYYSSKALNMMAYALTKAAGEPLDELFKRRIADPIGMDRRWDWGDFGYVEGMRVNNGSGSHFKGVHTTAQNLARLGLLLLNEGRWNDQQLLSGDWIAEASRPHVKADLPMHDPNGWYSVIRGAYGLGFWVNGIRADGERLWPDAPDGTFAIQGNLNNICLVIPEWDMVLVRMGTDNVIDNDRYTEVFALLKHTLLH